MAEKINYVKEVRKSIITEYAEFKDETIKKSPEEVYAEFGKIYAYENLHRSLAGWIFDEDVRDFELFDKERSNMFAKCLYNERGSILACLYDEYLSEEGRMIGTSDLLDDLVDDYTSKFYSEIRKEFEKEAVAV